MRTFVLTMLLASAAHAETTCDARHLDELEARLDEWAHTRVDPANLAADFKRLARRSNELQNALSRIANGKCGERSVNAAALSGRGYDLLATRVLELPAPDELSGEAVAFFRNTLARQAQPILERAREAFRQTLTHAKALGIQNQYVDEAQRWLDADEAASKMR